MYFVFSFYFVDLFIHYLLVSCCFFWQKCLLLLLQWLAIVTFNLLSSLPIWLCILLTLMKISISIAGMQEEWSYSVKITYSWNWSIELHQKFFIVVICKIVASCQFVTSIMKRKYDLIPSTVCFSKAVDNHQAKVEITQNLFQILTFEKHQLQQNREYYRFSPCLSMKFFCSLLTRRL